MREGMEWKEKEPSLTTTRNPLAHSLSHSLTHSVSDFNKGEERHKERRNPEQGT